MKRYVALSAVLGLLWTASGLYLLADKAGPAPTAPAVDFSLPDVNGNRFDLASLRGKKAVAVIFVGTECPLVQLYLPRLTEMQKHFAKDDVQFVAINSCMQDTTEAIKAHAEKFKLNFPMLIDADQKVADLFDARRTPTAYLLNAARQIVYKGRIDDQFGVGFQRPYVNRKDLAEAITEYLAGREISKPTTPAPGCIISRDKKVLASEVTYCKQISRIIQQHCLDCHRPGQLGPFSMMEYEKVKAWADTMRETIVDRRMPPWHADPRYGKFSNDRSLPEKDKELFLAWIDAGCPKGDEKDLPAAKHYPDDEGWSMGKPDVVLKMPEPLRIPALAPKGGYPYQYVMVPTNFKEDVWVQAVEARPGNKAVTHHILAFIQRPGQRIGGLARGQDSIGASLLVGTAPGDSPAIYPDGVGKKIPKGSYILMQMHYTPIGSEQWDQSQIGLKLCKSPPRFEGHTRAIMKRRFAIPPGEDNYRVAASSVFKDGAEILAILPHMHVRGKDFQTKLRYPDGREEIILNVPKYDFGWQTFFRYKDHIRVPPGTRMDVIAHFDNSQDNPNNPDHTKTVYWGDMTWEEMMIGWVDYYVPTQPLRAETTTESAQK